MDSGFTDAVRIHAYLFQYATLCFGTFAFLLGNFLDHDLGAVVELILYQNQKYLRCHDGAFYWQSYRQWQRCDSYLDLLVILTETLQQASLAEFGWGAFLGLNDQKDCADRPLVICKRLRYNALSNNDGEKLWQKENIF